jgi:hypothetical protein
MDNGAHVAGLGCFANAAYLAQFIIDVEQNFSGHNHHSSGLTLPVRQILILR